MTILLLHVHCDDRSSSCPALFRQLDPLDENVIPYNSSASINSPLLYEQIQHVTATPAELYDVLSERDISSLHESVGNRIS